MTHTFDSAHRHQVQGPVYSSHPTSDRRLEDRSHLTPSVHVRQERTRVLRPSQREPSGPGAVSGRSTPLSDADNRSCDRRAPVNTSGRAAPAESSLRRHWVHRRPGRHVPGLSDTDSDRHHGRGDLCASLSSAFKYPAGVRVRSPPQSRCAWRCSSRVSENRWCCYSSSSRTNGSSSIAAARR